MIEVEQRSRSDCLTACLASIFEVSYEDVPQFGRGWLRVLAEWLEGRGFAYLRRPRTIEDPADPMRCPWRFPGYWIAGVTSPRWKGTHAVVMHGHELVWDPSPRRGQGHRGFVDATYFVPLDPARLVLTDSTTRRD